MNARAGGLTIAALGVCLCASPAIAAVECFVIPEPVVSLDHGSRYTDDSRTRSDIDPGNNAGVNAALKPVDAFISALAKASNMALKEPAEASAQAACVGDALAEWAQADALSALETPNAHMSSPSRIAGMAFAYASVRSILRDDAQRGAIDAWLRRRADQMIAYWDRESPPKASRNNLRAWAAVAVARIGLTLGAEDLQHWAAWSALRVACDAASDGSLPREMERGPLALHYQLHAIGPLVVTAALLDDAGLGLFEACERAIPRAVDFTVAAIDNPDLVTAHADAPQSYATGDETLRAFEVAWAVAYLSFIENPDLRRLVSGFDTLGHSKLGGLQTLLWGAKG